MDNYDTKDQSSQSVSEPNVVYVKSPGEHHTVLSTPTTQSQENRMTVDEFCNMLHQYVDEYYDNIQG